MGIEYSNNNIMLSSKERLTSMQGHVVRECSWKVKLSLVMMSCRQWLGGGRWWETICWLIAGIEGLPQLVTHRCRC